MTEKSSEGQTRTLTKQQAVRHLIHASIRMIAAMEDPFAIHLLVQSADKMLVDLSKRSGKSLRYSWIELIKEEDRKRFMTAFRRTYNYFKHADSDHDEELQVRDVAQSNIFQLLICIENYHALFGENTNHMTLLTALAKTVFPGVIKTGDELIEYEAKLRAGQADMWLCQLLTPDLWDTEDLKEKIGDADAKLWAETMPYLALEQAEDLQDNNELFSTPIGEFARRPSASRRAACRRRRRDRGHGGV